MDFTLIHGDVLMAYSAGREVVGWGRLWACTWTHSLPPTLNFASKISIRVRFRNSEPAHRSTLVANLFQQPYHLTLWVYIYTYIHIPIVAPLYIYVYIYEFKLYVYTYIYIYTYIVYIHVLFIYIYAKAFPQSIDIVDDDQPSHAINH